MSATPDYDVCLSFAGEDRKYIERVANALKLAEVKVFYDAYEKVELWGKDLYQHLDEIYRRNAKYCVVFISADYVRKLWTGHELKSAQARAFEQTHQEYILPVRLDGSEVAGILPTVGYVNGTVISPEEVADLIVAKLRLTSREKVASLNTITITSPSPKPPSILFDVPKVSAIRERLREPFDACMRYHERVADLVSAGKWAYNIGSAYPAELLRANEDLADELRSFARASRSAAEEIDMKREADVRGLGNSLVSIAMADRLSGVKDALLSAAAAVEQLKKVRSIMQTEPTFQGVSASADYRATVEAVNHVSNEIDVAQERQEQSVGLINAYAKKPENS